MPPRTAPTLPPGTVRRLVYLKGLPRGLDPQPQGPHDRWLGPRGCGSWVIVSPKAPLHRLQTARQEAYQKIKTCVPIAGDPRHMGPSRLAFQPGPHRAPMHTAPARGHHGQNPQPSPRRPPHLSGSVPTGEPGGPGETQSLPAPSQLKTLQMKPELQAHLLGPPPAPQA